MSILLLVLYIALFVSIAIIDLKYQIIPNRIIYPSIPVCLAISALFPLGMLEDKVLPVSLLFASIGCVFGFLLLFIPALKFPDSVGMGDAKLAGLIGAINGFPGIVIALGIAFVFGAGGSLFKNKLNKDMPFGPFLCAGGLIVLIWGNDIINLYGGLY